MSEPWVITLRMTTSHVDPRAGRCESITIKEYYRGDMAECRRIFAAVKPPYMDVGPPPTWTVIAGPAKAWDDFLSDD